MPIWVAPRRDLQVRGALLPNVDVREGDAVLQLELHLLLQRLMVCAILCVCRHAGMSVHVWLNMYRLYMYILYRLYICFVLLIEHRQKVN